MRNIGKSQIYIVPELTANNEQWINPGFGNPDLQAHYDYIKRMVKEKTGRAMQEKERERKGKNGKDRSYLSTSYFSRLFRDETGCSIIQMLQKYRMDAARELLENTVYTIEEVASRVGYFDLKHFYRIFHRHNGCTPGEYRSRLQK